MKTLSLCVLLYTMNLLVGAATLPKENGGSNQEVRKDLVKRSMGCFQGWTSIHGRCFVYVSKPMTWAQAEKHCRLMGANLASVHSKQEYGDIQKVIMKGASYNKKTWIGGSNAQELNIWLWSDGSVFSISDWCDHEPNNYKGRQYCLQMNHTAKKCWDDLECSYLLPSICAKKI